MNTSQIYGWDLNFHRGFSSFDDAVRSMDDNPEYGSFWLVDYSVYELKTAPGIPMLWEFVCHGEDINK